MGKSAKLSVTLSRKTFELEINAGESLLDAALRGGVDAPYSCMEGVCISCLAMVKEGELDFPDDTILSDEDRAQGRTLTCQAKVKPGCARVVINYDEA